MDVDFIIVGQGICGTWVSWFLMQAKKTFIIIDNADLQSASRMAAGVINQAAGKRFASDSENEMHIEFALHNYKLYEELFKVHIVKEMDIVQFFEDTAHEKLFAKKVSEQNKYFDFKKYKENETPFYYTNSKIGVIQHCAKIDILTFMASMQQYAKLQEKFISEKFDYEKLIVENNEVKYKNITANKIIFAEGVFAINNPYCKHLQFANTKGEALIVRIENLPQTIINKQKHMLVPVGENLFWVGASMSWLFEHENISSAFYAETEKWLQTFLKIPFTIVKHIASIRPTLVNRKPIAAIHTEHLQIGILNGMGAKACSLAPFYAKQLVEQMIK